MDSSSASFVSLMRAQYNKLRGEATPPEPASVSLFRHGQEWREATIKAALSGYFSPDELFAVGVSEEIKREVLTLLAEQCMIERSNEGARWILAQPVRQNLLKELTEQNILDTYLKGPLPSTDSQGALLRSVLQTKQVSGLEQIPLETLVDLSFVFEALELIDIGKPDPAVLNAYLGRAAMLADFNVLLSNGFFGRKEAQGTLDSFASHFSDSDKAEWLILAGIGGAGKSTLLAEFLQRKLMDDQVVITLLDFDRPGIHPADPDWLDAEISRQVGYQVTAGNALLSGTGSAIPMPVPQVRETEPESLSALRSERRGKRNNIRQQVVDIMQSAAGVSGFVLVLDTFEEVLDRNMFSNISEWLKDWDTRFRNSPLYFRIILSGRLNSGNVSFIQEQTNAKLLPVAELDTREAEEMLRGLQVKRFKAKRLASSPHIPRHPLELKLIARILQADPGLTIKELERELRKEGGVVAREFFAGVIYRRVLLRIQNEIARTIAYPGLVLRYVNRRILEEVLLPALDLQHLDPLEIETAFAELISHQWLLTEDAGNYWHRRDIRASMIRAIWNQEPEKAEKITLAALEYFRRMGDTTEVFYHELMLYGDAPNPSFSSGDHHRKAAQELAPYIPNFPYRAQIFVKYLVGNAIPTHEIFLLPPNHIFKAYDDRGLDLVRARRFMEAYLLIKAYEKFKGTKGSAGSTEDWRIQTYAATVQWDTLSAQLEYIEFPREQGDILKNHQNTLNTIHYNTAPAFLSNFGELLNDFHYIEPLLTHRDRAVAEISYVQKLSAGAIKFNAILPGVLKGRSLLRNFFRKHEKSLSVKESGSAFERDIFLLYSKTHIVMPGTQAVIRLSDLPLNPRAIRMLDVPGLYPFSRDYFTILTQLHTELFRNKLIDPIPTSRDLLNTIDGLIIENVEYGKTRLYIDPYLYSGRNLLKVLRGPDPAFRDPCRYALLDAFTTRHDFEELATLIGNILPYKLMDLAPETFIDLMEKDGESTLENFVELIDRCWALGRMLDLAVEIKPGKLKLQLVQDAYSSWNDAVVKAILDINHGPFR